MVNVMTLPPLLLQRGTDPRTGSTKACAGETRGSLVRALRYSIVYWRALRDNISQIQVQAAFGGTKL